ncbi:MAG: winged helix-turn-helix transcriptional regulator [Haloferacaceae archaeon]
MEYRLDEIDRRILYHLVADARDTSAPEIADEVDVSPGTIRNRIRQLENYGIITGYHAHVDYERVDDRITDLFKCTVPVTERERVAKQALEIPGVVNVRELLSGTRNLHVMAIGDNTDDLTRIGKALTELGADIDEEDLIRREYTHPYHPFGPEGERDRPTLADFVSLSGGAEVVEFTVTEESRIAELTLAEADEEGILGDDVLVVGIERGDTILTPKGKTVVEPGDVITIFSRGSLPPETVDAFDGA